MGTTKQDISQWFDKKKKEGCTHMIIVCDTFDYGDYPIGVRISDNVRKIEEKYSVNMQIVMEMYDLSKDKETQIDEHTAFNY